MKTKITILSIIVITVFLVGCPMMTKPSQAPNRDVTGGEETPAAPTAGSISVVNDEARGQAVYINENGVRFDVVAEEYAGGPVARCVDVADFTVVPPSSDSDALPVKAVVIGTRDDGTPGVWQINSDDSISLPEPETTTDDTARCIIGGDMATLPGSVQLRYGWTFETDSVSADGKMIVGHAVNKNGVVIGGVPIAAGSPIGVYWRAYSVPFSRFVVVSPPRIIGTLVKPPVPAGWIPDPRHFTAILAALKAFFTGTLEAYLSLPDKELPGTKVKVTVLPTGNPGEYSVKGVNEYGDRAIAIIDKVGNVSVNAVPDLTVASVSVTQVQGASGEWTVSATVNNKSSGASKGFKVSFSVTGQTVTIDPVPNPPGWNGTDAATVTQTFTFAPPSGTYTMVATVAAVPQDYEWDTTNNSASANFDVAASPGQGNTYSRIIIDTYEPDATMVAVMTGMDALALYKVDASGNLFEIASDPNLYNDSPYVSANPDSDPDRGAGLKFAYIDYQGTPLTSGTYYIRITASYPALTGTFGAYAIRILTAPDVMPRDASWFFSTPDGTYSDAYETDDSQPGSPPAVPTSTGTLASIELGTGAQALVRTLGTSTDVDWVKLVLP